LTKIAAARILDAHARGRFIRGYVAVLEENSRDRASRSKK